MFWFEPSPTAPPHRQVRSHRARSGFSGWVSCTFVLLLGLIASDQQRIVAFLKKIGEEKHADKFTSWEHLLYSKSRVLKHKLSLPVQSRKNILRAVEFQKQFNTFGPYDPRFGPFAAPVKSQSKS